MRKILLIAAIMLSGGVCLAQMPFYEYGTVEEVLYCYRLNAFGGDHYELSWTGPLSEYVGETVCVFGVFQSQSSVCMAGMCCVQVDSINVLGGQSSRVPASTPTGILILCLLIIASGAVLIHRRVCGAARLSG